MALTSKKLPPMPSGTGGDFDRSEDKDFYIAGMQTVEIYSCVNDAVALPDAIEDVQTGMNFVRDGYLFDIAANSNVAGATVNPSATDPTIATVTGFPLTASKQYILVVIGEKNPAQAI